MSKVMTQEKAKEYVGKYIDCEKRHFHYYPLKIVEIKDECYARDITGTNICIPYESEKHNDFFYDYIFELVGGDGWIPVSERLPDKPFGCDVTILDSNPATMEEYETVLFYHVGFDGENWNDIDGNTIPFEVIAWKPAPEPYREG